MTLFSAVLAPNTSNTTMLELDQATALRQMGVVLTNEVYDGVRIPDQQDELEEIMESRKTFLKKPAVRLAGLVITIVLAVGTPLAIVFHRPPNQAVSLLPSSIP